jgi:stage III sporulation protein AF
MGAITAWVRGIVLLVLAVTFLEMLVPRSSLKKFVDMVMGLAVIGAMVSPLVNIGMGYLSGELVASSALALPAASKTAWGTEQPWDAQEIASRLTETVIEAKARDALSDVFAESHCSWEIRASVDRNGNLQSMIVSVGHSPGSGSGREEHPSPGESAVVSTLSTVLEIDPGMVIVSREGRK